MIQMEITERTSMASLRVIFSVLFPVMESRNCLLSLKLAIGKILATRVITKQAVVGIEYETVREIMVILGLYFFLVKDDQCLVGQRRSYYGQPDAEALW